MLNTILQGIIQGLTEFLPVSSSGHLSIFQYFTKSQTIETGSTMTFDLVLHFGTLIAVIYYFWKDIYPYFTVNGWKDPSRRKIAWLVIVASIPTAIIGFGIKKYVEAMMEKPLVVCGCFLFTGIILLLSEKLKNQKANSTTLPELSYGKAIATGVAQGIACAPGISRSGSTIAAGLLCGLKGEEAARFSFLLMIVSVGGATLLDAVKVLKIVKNTGSLPEGLIPSHLIVGVITSMIVGFLSLKFLVYIINKQKLSYFAYYLFAVSIICISLILFAGM